MGLEDFWVLRGGRNASVLRTALDWSNKKAEAATEHYKNILKTSDFRRLRTQYAFQTVVASISDCSYDFPVFEVDEVGYKLGKRGERPRPNQLFRLQGKENNQAITNLHLAQEE